MRRGQKGMLVVALVALVTAATCVSAAVPAVQAVRSCGSWNVGGTWTTRQSNTGPLVTFVFRQTGTLVTGTARVGTVSENFHGTLSGTIKGAKLIFVVSWNQRTSGGQQLKGHYAGSVSAGRITGSTYALNAPESAVWSATGIARCR